jgi:SAM-dependent methyltransferase
MAEAATNPWNRDKPYDMTGSWVSSQPYVAILNERLTGDPTKHWLTYAAEKYICLGDTTDKSCLLLGANEGYMERLLRTLGFAGSIVASDIADLALARAKATSEAAGLNGIQYVRMDLNQDSIEGKFDYVIAEGVLHHIVNIEACMSRIVDALKPGGLLIAQEYTGAWRFQLPDIQVEWINAALAAVPRKYRPLAPNAFPLHPASQQDRASTYYVKATEAEMVAFDPSEAISGFKIPGLIADRFDVIEERKAGGGLVTFMSGHFPFERTNHDAECAAWLKIIADIEMTLCDQGIVPSELRLYVAARPRD